jgi:hypothetical protein
MIWEMTGVIESVKVSMKNSQERAKHYADKKRSFHEFEMDDKVFLKVTPQRSELKLGKSKNLPPRFCGSFEITKQIGPVAYELRLPSDWKIHNVFHISLLRKYLSDPTHMLSELPNAILDSRIVMRTDARTHRQTYGRMDEWTNVRMHVRTQG